MIFFCLCLFCRAEEHCISEQISKTDIFHDDKIIHVLMAKKFLGFNKWNIFDQGNSSRTTSTVDVLWGQPTKLIQVVPTSEFHEY